MQDNLTRIIPKGLCANIELNKIKTQPIFNWLKNQGVNDQEMLNTFNCGVGFCLIIKPKHLKIVEKFFNKNYKPYTIGKISIDNKKYKSNGKVNWKR